MRWLVEAGTEVNKATTTARTRFQLPAVMACVICLSMECDIEPIAVSLASRSRLILVRVCGGEPCILGSVSASDGFAVAHALRAPRRTSRKPRSARGSL